MVEGTKRLQSRKQRSSKSPVDVLAGRGSLREICKGAGASGRQSCQIAASFQLYDSASAARSRRFSSLQWREQQRPARDGRRALSWRALRCACRWRTLHFNVVGRVQSLEPPDVQYPRSSRSLRSAVTTTVTASVCFSVFAASFAAPEPADHFRTVRLPSSNHPDQVHRNACGTFGARSGPVAGAVIALGLLSHIVILIAPVLILTRRSRMPVTIAARPSDIRTAASVPLIQAAWCALRSPSAAAFQDKPLATPFHTGQRRRLVWLVFDEMDERFVSRRRSRSIALSELTGFEAKRSRP
jgi:hypothetical protein